MDINEKYYEYIALKNSEHYDEIIRALEIVKRFLIKEQRILVGGMAIDMGLKLKGEKGIYDEHILPDYDFYSYEHFKDAYRLAEWLHKMGFKNISVINALHPSTIKVRVNFIVVADITYIPRHIIQHIPTLFYKGFKIIHPHVQMIDQHRSLSFPYENAPWETVMFRAKKDMKRYDMLYNQYPLRLLNIKDKTLQLKSYEFPLELFKNQCITGFFGLVYWSKVAQKYGFKPSGEFGDFDIIGGVLKYSIPLDSHGISLYSDNLEELYKMFLSVYKNKQNPEIRFYNRFLDKLPRKIIIDNELELLDNNQKIAAHKSDIKDVYITNLQNIMMYLLVNYILLMKIKNIKRGFSFYKGYLECRNLIEWASNKYYTTTNPEIKDALKQFFPTAETYGERNISESYIVAKQNFDKKNKTLENELNYSQPYHLYDKDFNNGRAPPGHFKFNVHKSEIFDIDGEQINPFF